MYIIIIQGLQFAPLNNNKYLYNFKGYINMDDGSTMHLEKYIGKPVGKTQIPVETVLHIVDHVMEKMKYEQNNQEQVGM